MKYLDRTFPDPAADLAADEALLEVCEAGGAPGGVLRVYETRLPAVVLGYGNRAAVEADLEACRRDGVPVLRRAAAVLFHGTFLLAFDLERIGRYLRTPSWEPEYRRGRTHGEFVTNLGVSAEAVKTALALEWAASEPWETPLEDRVSGWMESRYGRGDWHGKF